VLQLDGSEGAPRLCGGAQERFNRQTRFQASASIVYLSPSVSSFRDSFASLSFHFPFHRCFALDAASSDPP
jgi:hypothetical protein